MDGSNECIGYIERQVAKMKLLDAETKQLDELRMTPGFSVSLILMASPQEKSYAWQQVVHNSIKKNNVGDSATY